MSTNVHFWEKLVSRRPRISATHLFLGIPKMCLQKSLYIESTLIIFIMSESAAPKSFDGYYSCLFLNTFITIDTLQHTVPVLISHAPLVSIVLWKFSQNLPKQAKIKDFLKIVLFAFVGET